LSVRKKILRSEEADIRGKVSGDLYAQDYEISSQSTIKSLQA
jgi:hypothetical protein